MTKHRIPALHKDKHLLNDKVALAKGFEDESSKTFKISFDHYNSNHCEIDVLQQSSARKCLLKLKQFGQSNPRTLLENGIQAKSVQNTGSYSVLFSKLSKDIKLFEIDIGSASRLFYFLVGSIIHIVAIKNSHFKY